MIFSKKSSFKKKSRLDDDGFSWCVFFFESTLKNKKRRIMRIKLIFLLLKNQCFNSLFCLFLGR